MSKRYLLFLVLIAVVVAGCEEYIGFDEPRDVSLVIEITVPVTAFNVDVWITIMTHDDGTNRTIPPLVEDFLNSSNVELNGTADNGTFHFMLSDNTLWRGEEGAEGMLGFDGYNFRAGSEDLIYARATGADVDVEIIFDAFEEACGTELVERFSLTDGADWITITPEFSPYCQ